jgi:hypothetical protein
MESVSWARWRCVWVHLSRRVRAPRRPRPLSSTPSLQAPLPSKSSAPPIQTQCLPVSDGQVGLIQNDHLLNSSADSHPIPCLIQEEEKKRRVLYSNVSPAVPSYPPPAPLPFPRSSLPRAHKSQECHPGPWTTKNIYVVTTPSLTADLPCQSLSLPLAPARSDQTHRPARGALSFSFLLSHNSSSSSSSSWTRAAPLKQATPPHTPAS